MKKIIIASLTFVLATTIFASSEMKIVFPDKQTIQARLHHYDSRNIWHSILHTQISKQELTISELMELVNKAINIYASSCIAQGTSSRVIDQFGYQWKQKTKKDLLKALLHEHPEILKTLSFENQNSVRIVYYDPR